MSTQFYLFGGIQALFCNAELVSSPSMTAEDVISEYFQPRTENMYTGDQLEIYNMHQKWIFFLVMII